MAGKKTSEASSSTSRTGKRGPLGSGKIKIALVDPHNNGLKDTSVLAIQDGSVRSVMKTESVFEVVWDPTSTPVFLAVFQSPAGQSARKDAGMSKSKKKAGSNPTTSKAIPKKLAKSTTRKVK